MPLGVRVVIAVFPVVPPVPNLDDAPEAFALSKAPIAVLPVAPNLGLEVEAFDKSTAQTPAPSPPPTPVKVPLDWGVKGITFSPVVVQLPLLEELDISSVEPKTDPDDEMMPPKHSFVVSPVPTVLTSTIKLLILTARGNGIHARYWVPDGRALVAA
jgi:hypothetical protein